MLIAEAIQRIQSAYSKGMQSDDSRLSNRHIYSKLRTSRIRIISQQLSKKQIVNQWCYQPIIVKMISTSTVECSEIQSATCKILKSEKPLPQIFTNMDKHLIQSVTSIDGSLKFDQTHWEDITYKKGRKYTQDLPEYYIKDGYLFITNRKVLGLVMLTALFNDPIEAKKYSNSCGGVQVDSCTSNLYYDLALDGKFEETVIEMTKDEVLWFASARDDQKNNAADDIAITRRDRGSNQNRDNNGQ